MSNFHIALTLVGLDAVAYAELEGEPVLVEVGDSYRYLDPEAARVLLAGGEHRNAVTFPVETWVPTTEERPVGLCRMKQLHTAKRLGVAIPDDTSATGRVYLQWELPDGSRTRWDVFTRESAPRGVREKIREYVCAAVSVGRLRNLRIEVEPLERPESAATSEPAPSGV